jgi:hypothetical protein
MDAPQGTPITDLKNNIKRAKKRSGLTKHLYPRQMDQAFGKNSTILGVNRRRV